jgi:hypothetical protein
MAYYYEIFTKNANEDLVHIGSCNGSDTPCYFENVTNIKTFQKQLKKLQENNGFYEHSDKHPFPWSSYKTSDDLIVLVENKKRFFQFWKRSHSIYISYEKYDVKDNNKCSFAPFENWKNNDCNEKDIIIFDLPILKKF